MYDARAIRKCGLEAPAIGEVLPVLPGIGWIRMPVPGPLGHINLWELRESDITFVDAGLGEKETIDAWQAVLSECDRKGNVARLLLTHHHPDHAGATGWLSRHCDCHVTMTGLEFAACRRELSLADPASQVVNDALRAAGWDDAMLDAQRAFHGRFGQALQGFPERIRLLEEGNVLLGGRQWRVIVTGGHTPAHASLYNEQDSILIAGDQLLPDMAAIVPVSLDDLDSDPLGEWFASLSRMASILPEDVLVLPSHGHVFRGAHARISEIEEGHRVRLERTFDALSIPRTPAELVRALYRRPVDGRTVSLLTGEAMAYANRLVALGQAKVEEDGKLRRYSRIS
ncbi:MBL fold metallo-hydrolase [Altererythrobacter sp. Z27]|uniref:MBL fold metallo-hydrolase n=1 Tax=Altererythrobacter sp. Z27 TaxID=3461147 RepID=UPI0040451980